MVFAANGTVIGQVHHPNHDAAASFATLNLMTLRSQCEVAVRRTLRAFIALENDFAERLAFQ